MSTNIHFAAEREILVIKTGKTSTQRIHFDAWQTPSSVTRNIMQTTDRISAYKDWILVECSHDEIVNVYAAHDYCQEDPPIGTKIVNEGKEHIAEFEEWVAASIEDGYEIVAEAW